MTILNTVDYHPRVAVKRRYESHHRRQQADRTRQSVLEAAGRLFVDPGYAATPLTTVAAEAGVSVQTVYKVFGTKRELLSALVDVSIAGDAEDEALPERAFVGEIEALSGLRPKLGRYARHLSAVHARQAPVMRALAGAATADPEAAEVLRKNDEERRAGMTMFGRHLSESTDLRADLDLDEVVDVLWLAMDWRNYEWLVQSRGWSPERFEEWYVDTVAAALSPRER
jgi:TetR/AcrR family transcriptional regulator, regulator of autoinduction and epiphytic fitness